MEDAQARHRVVARQHHHLHPLGLAVGGAGIEGQQLARQREGHARRRRLVDQAELQLHVGAVVAGLEDLVLGFEVEQRT